MAAFKVQYHKAPGYGSGRDQVEARVEIGVLGISGYGATSEEARQDLLCRVKVHRAAVDSTICLIELSAAPQDEPPANPYVAPGANRSHND